MNTSNTSPAVSTQADGPLWLITISRPEARNAVNRAVAEGLARAMAELDERPELRVGIITGAGGNFCSGMDLKAFAGGEIPMLPVGGFAGFVEQPPRKPLIAAVEGYALAGGFEIAANAPLAVAASKQVVRQSLGWGEREMFARQQPLLADIAGTADALEGARAFAEKRAPVWQGR